MKVTILGAAALLLVGACGKDSDKASPELAAVTGLYEATPASFLRTQVDGNLARITMPFSRAQTGRDATAVPTCPSPASADSVVDAGTAAGGGSEAVNLELSKNGHMRYAHFFHLDTPAACVLTREDTLTVTADQFLAQQLGITISYTLADQGRSLVLAYTFDSSAPPPLNEVDPSESTWLYGSWKQVDPAGEATLVISKSPPLVSLTEFRQVGVEGDSEVPFPTICLTTSSASAYQLVYRPIPGGDDVVALQWTPEAHELVNDARNSARCASYLDRILQRGELPLETLLEPTANGGLRVDRSLTFAPL